MLKYISIDDANKIQEPVDLFDEVNFNKRSLPEMSVRTSNKTAVGCDI